MQGEKPIAVPNDDTLFEQYKLYYELTDKFGEARRSSFRFHITALFVNGAVALLGLVFAGTTVTFTAFEVFILVAVGFLGVIICISWGADSNLYSEIWTARIAVIEDMEKGLTYHTIKKERDYRAILRDDLDKKSIVRRFIRKASLSSILKAERLPYFFVIPYLLLIILSLVFYFLM